MLLLFKIFFTKSKKFKNLVRFSLKSKSSISISNLSQIKQFSYQLIYYFTGTNRFCKPKFQIFSTFITTKINFSQKIFILQKSKIFNKYLISKEAISNKYLLMSSKDILHISIARNQLIIRFPNNYLGSPTEILRDVVSPLTQDLRLLDKKGRSYTFILPSYQLNLNCKFTTEPPSDLESINNTISKIPTFEPENYKKANNTIKFSSKSPSKNKTIHTSTLSNSKPYHHVQQTQHSTKISAKPTSSQPYESTQTLIQSTNYTIPSCEPPLSSSPTIATSTMLQRTNDINIEIDQQPTSSSSLSSSVSGPTRLPNSNMNNTNNIDSQVSLRSKSKFFKLPEANHESLHKIKTPFDKQQKSLNIEETAVIPPTKQSYSQVNASTSQDTSIPTTKSTDHPRNNLSPVIHRSVCRKSIPYTYNDLFKAITKCQTSSSVSVTPTPIINVKPNPHPPPPPPCIKYAARQLQDVASPQAVVLAPYHSSAASNTPPNVITTSIYQHPTNLVYRQQAPSYSVVVSNDAIVSSADTTGVVSCPQDSEVQLLSNTFQDLLSKISTYQTVVDLLETKYESLSTQVVDVHSNITTLSQGQSTIQTSLVHLHTDISSQMSTVQSTMSTQMTSLLSNTTSMMHRLFTQLPNPHHLPDGHGASQVDD